MIHANFHYLWPNQKLLTRLYTSHGGFIIRARKELVSLKNIIKKDRIKKMMD